MSIIQCPKCKNSIHKAKTCYLCGTDFEFEKYNILKDNENRTEINELQQMLYKEDYISPLNMTSLMLEDGISDSDVFWIRCLAKHRCQNAFDLISAGIDCTEDPDFVNAFKNAGEYINTYNAISTKIQELQKSLLIRLEEEKNTRIKNSGIHRIKQESDKRFQEYKERLKRIIDEIIEVENEIKFMELSFNLANEKNRIELEEVHSKAKEIENEATGIIEYEPANFSIYAKIDALQEVSEQIYSTYIEENKEKQDLRNNRIRTRDQLIDDAHSIISDMKTYGKELLPDLEKISSIEDRFEKLRQDINSFHFISFRKELGNDEYIKILRKCGIYGEFRTQSRPSSYERCNNGNINVTESKQTISPNEQYSYDYYEAWGLNDEE